MGVIVGVAGGALLLVMLTGLFVAGQVMKIMHGQLWSYTCVRRYVSQLDGACCCRFSCPSARRTTVCVHLYRRDKVSAESRHRTCCSASSLPGPLHHVCAGAHLVACCLLVSSPAVSRALTQP